MLGIILLCSNVGITALKHKKNIEVMEWMCKYVSHKIMGCIFISMP